MTRALTATWSAINLVAGLLLTFLAPTFYSQVARPVAVGYLFILGAVIAISQLRTSSLNRNQLLAVATISIVAAVSILLTDTASIDYQLLVSTWALAQGSMLLIGSLKHGVKSSQGRDFFSVSMASAILGLVLLLPGAAPRNQLGYFSAYLLVTGVLYAIASATPSK